MSAWDEARARWDEELRDTQERARAAVTVLSLLAAAIAVEGAFGVVELVPPRGEALVQAGVVLENALQLATIVLFLRWLSRSVGVARRLGGDFPAGPRRLHWTGGEAVWSFFIPFLNLFRPYQLLRDLHDHLDPDAVPEPAPRPRLDGTGGYRDVPVDRPPPPRALPHASIKAFWALYLAPTVASLFFGRVLAADVMAVGRLATNLGAVLLAVPVVRVLQARLEERHRRLRHATDEDLAVWLRADDEARGD